MQRNNGPIHAIWAGQRHAAVPAIIESFFTLQATETAVCRGPGVGRLFLTGEGSSRIFPAKNVHRPRAALRFGRCNCTRRADASPRNTTWPTGPCSLCPTPAGRPR